MFHKCRRFLLPEAVVAPVAAELALAFAAELEAATGAAEVEASVAAGAALLAGQAEATADELLAAEAVELLATAEAPPAETAAVISAAVASSTRRFWVKMQPSGSSRVSQVLPAPVLSAT